MYKSLHLILTQLYEGGANIIPTLQTGKLRHIGSNPRSQSKQAAQTGFKTWHLVPEAGALNTLTAPSLDQHSGSRAGKWWSQNSNKTDLCSAFILQILPLLVPSCALGCVLDTSWFSVTSTMRQDRLNPSPWVALIMNEIPGWEHFSSSRCLINIIPSPLTPHILNVSVPSLFTNSYSLTFKGNDHLKQAELKFDMTSN